VVIASQLIAAVERPLQSSHIGVTGVWFWPMGAGRIHPSLAMPLQGVQRRAQLEGNSPKPGKLSEVKDRVPSPGNNPASFTLALQSDPGAQRRTRIDCQ
jgi:hypothetical protein